MLQFGIIATSEFLYFITNQAVDAIKALIDMVNMKLGASSPPLSVGILSQCQKEWQNLTTWARQSYRWS